MGWALKPIVEKATADAILSLRQTCHHWSNAEVASFIPAGKAVRMIAERGAQKLGCPVEFVLFAKNLTAKDLEKIDAEVTAYLAPIAESSDDTKRHYIREVQALTLFHDLLSLRGAQRDYPGICPSDLGVLLENLANLMGVLYHCSEEQADPARVLVRMISRQLVDDPTRLVRSFN